MSIPGLWVEKETYGVIHLLPVSGIGGDRPKALLYEDNTAYLAKFNRLTTDAYNNAKVELACLQMAKEAGLNVLDGHVRRGVNGRDVLLLDRFDVVTGNNLLASRRHHRCLIHHWQIQFDQRICCVLLWI